MITPMSSRAGFSMVEIALASALFLILGTSIMGLISQSYGSNRLGLEETMAHQYASEGIEAVRSIKNQSFIYLVNSSSTGVSPMGGLWTFSGTSTRLLDKYVRVIRIEDVYRDASGNVVENGGTLDVNTKKIQSDVSWNFTSGRPESINLKTYLTDWRKLYDSASKNGMLVYGAGGTSSDAIMYRVLDAATQAWSVATSTADIDASTTNKAVRALKLFASPLGKEKILMTKHLVGTSAISMYAQVWNGTSSSWGDVVSLKSFTLNTGAGIEMMDGAYLNNGDFMAVYSDNTGTPKYKIWNGSSWSVERSTGALSNGTPYWLVLRNRPGTNEAMLAVYTSSRRADTQYYNGAGYLTGNWVSNTQHTNNSPVNTKKIIDFVWSPQDSTRGVLFYSDATNDKKQNMKTWTANGSGGGSWSSTVNTPTNAPANIGAITSDGRLGTTEFVSCNKITSQTIQCYRASSTLAAPTWSNPTNYTLTSGAQSGVQQSVGFRYEKLSGALGVAVYSDNTTTPKYKKYNPSTNAFDPSSTSIASVSATVTTVLARARPASNDILFLIGDNNRRVYSIIWDGENDQMYATPAGFALMTHGTNGSSGLEFWYDFVWDN